MFFIFGVLSLHLTMIYFNTPLLAVMLHLQPLFANDILDHNGRARSRRRASARRGKASLISYWKK